MRCHQVEAVTVTGGGRLTLQAFGAHLSSKRIQLYGVDPEGDDALAGAVAGRSTRETDEPVVRELEGGAFEIAAPAMFRRRLLDIAAGQLLCWAGLGDAAQARLLGDRELPRADLDRLDHRETETGEFVGVSANLPVQEGVRYETFFGLDKAVAAALLADDDDVEAGVFDDFARRAEPSLATTRERLSSAIEADAARQDSEGAVTDELERSPTIHKDSELPPASATRVRPGARHVALDDPQDDTSVAGASLDGLFLEVRAR
jgi:hypothetical protein